MVDFFKVVLLLLRTGSLNPCLKASDFPGSPVVKILRFRCKGQVFDPWSGNYDPTWQATEEKQKKRRLPLVMVCRRNYH